MNRADLFAIVAGCRAGEKRVMELCDRFGKETYLAGSRRCSTAPTRRCGR
jgi:N-methylhydantoinase B